MADVDFEVPSEPTSPGCKVSESKLPESTVAESKVAESKVPESKVPESKAWDSALLATDQTSKHALVFSVAEKNFAIAADFIEQIVELPGIAEVPQAGSTLLGLADHAGHPIPVVDISPLLKLDSVGLDGFRHGLLLNTRD